MGAGHIHKEDFRNALVSLEVPYRNEYMGKCLVVHLLDKYGHETGGIMMASREEEEIKEEVKALCEKYKPQKVLEVGFGMGFTATQFQECGVEKHVIVEANAQMARDAHAWRKNYPHKDIEIAEEFLQDYVYDEKDYDLIYDDRYDLLQRNKDLRAALHSQGFVRRESGGTFPCWKVIRDRTKKVET